MYLRSQIITYMGNKRKLIGPIQEALDIVKGELKHDNLVLGDGFSGSGVVSRLMKENAKELYVNDIANYSYTLSNCYLSDLSDADLKIVKKLIQQANIFAESNKESDKVTPWLQRHWAPVDDMKITERERAFFTHANGVRLDRYRYFIEKYVPLKYKFFLLGPLLVQASIHNNTNGHFASFYKMNGIGHFGGQKDIDLRRIMKPIELEMPVFSQNKCPVHVSCEDTNQWIKNLPTVDLVYYDPPYNKHPYSVYYFMLDVINNFDITEPVPATTRGQASTWRRSDYNSNIKAKASFSSLIEHTNSKYILVSYNSAGIITLEEMEKILSKKGTIRRIDMDHKTYNRLKGIASYKRKQDFTKIKEYLWLVDCRKNIRD